MNRREIYTVSSKVKRPKRKRREESMAKPVDPGRRKFINRALETVGGGLLFFGPLVLGVIRESSEEKEKRMGEYSWPTTLENEALCYTLGKDGQPVPIIINNLPVKLPEGAPVVLDAQSPLLAYGEWNEIPGFAAITVYFEKDDDKYRIVPFKKVKQAIKEGKPTEQFSSFSGFVRAGRVKNPNRLTDIFDQPIEEVPHF